MKNLSNLINLIWVFLIVIKTTEIQAQKYERNQPLSWKNSIDLIVADLTDGIYVCKLISSQRNMQQKFVKH